MTKNQSQKSALIMLSVLSAIISTTFLISIVARGYLPDFNNGLKIKATGLLSATSNPKNAKVFINDKLYTTTDDSINLIPGDYQLRIVKDGYLPWNKQITIQQEYVYPAEASLFRSNPILNPLTLQGITNPTANYDLTQIAYIVPISTHTSKPGIYLIENSYLSLLLNRYQPKFIIANPFSSQDNSLTLEFSPNSRQLILKSTLKHLSYLIDLSTNSSVIATDKNTLDWQNQFDSQNLLNLAKIPKIFFSTIATNPASISFSPNETKFLYTLNQIYYCYDLEKELNYEIGPIANFQSLFWLPKSNSLIYTNQNHLKTVEYDGTNNNTIYSDTQPLKSLIPLLDGEKIIISANHNNLQNLYTLIIK